MFKGHGIVVLPLAALGFFLGAMFFGLVFLFVDVKVNWLSPIMGLWSAAALVWLYAVTLGKPKMERVYNHAIGGYEMQLSRHALFFMSAKTWSWIFLGVALVGSVALPQVPQIRFSSPPRLSNPATNTFDEANLAITTARHGVAQGNTKNAIRLATDFSKTLKLFREAGIEKSKKKEHAMSLTNGEFITYCHLTTDTCAFLVHVPELRNYNSDAKEFIADAAWHSATAAVLEMPNPPKRLAVGVRGVLLYDAILIGEVISPAENAEEGIKKRLGATDKEALYPFFAVTSRKKATDTPASATPSANSQPSSAKSPAAAPSAIDEAPPARKSPPTSADTTPQAVPPAPASTPAPPSAAAVLPTPVRDWISADGRPLRASVLGFNADGTAARVQREDGMEFEVPLDKFSAGDQAELNRLKQASPPPAPGPQ